ncbi:calcium-dependent phosphotriesterase [Calocera cornea HHB12733]|uniref:Calcium-dependent phosphotriesterase n=1 Tax=Calocera cornea HHB12733 TaxID=1353952 RepID=A0A165IB84_9BASI|nr:calcium-dependent phosphotriesterase [Calocera cornea HHB12733]
MAHLSTLLLRASLLATLLALSYRLYTFYPILVAQPLPTWHFSPSALSPAHPHNATARGPGTCHKIHSPARDLSHCEDLTEWVSGSGSVLGLLASCDPNRRNWNTVMGPLRDPTPRGAVWLIHPQDDTAQRIPFVGYPDTHDFHPLGIAALPSAPGEPTTLFAVNHGRHNSTIEVFLLSPPRSADSVGGEEAGPSLTYVRTLTHPRLIAPNAVVPLSPSTLLITQDHTFTRRLLPPLGPALAVLESTLGLPGGSVDVLQFQPGAPDPPTLTTAVSHIAFANGLALSPHTNTLAVAASSHAAVHLYHLPASSTVLLLPLRRKATIPLPFAPDNLSFSPSGTLYASGHPNFPALVAHARGAHTRAPSWVAAVSPEGELSTLYQSAGGEGEEVIEASTTAVVDEERGRVWIAGLYAEGILSCSA